MKDCTLMQQKISCMIDMELSESELCKLRAHIAVCPECKALFEAFSAVSAELGELEDIPGGSVAPQVMKAISAKKRSHWLRLLPLAACFAVAIFFGVQKGLPSSNNVSAYDTPSPSYRTLSDDTGLDEKITYDSAGQGILSGDSTLSKNESAGSASSAIDGSGSVSDSQESDSLPDGDGFDLPDIIPGSADKPDFPDTSHSGTGSDSTFTLSGADRIAQLKALLGEPDGTLVPEGLQPICTVYLIEDGSDTALDICIDGGDVYVCSGDTAYKAACTIDELNAFLISASD